MISEDRGWDSSTQPSACERSNPLRHSRGAYQLTTHLKILESAYASTDNAEEETKDNFYRSLQAVLDTISRHDVTLGYFNARVRQNNH